MIYLDSSVALAHVFLESRSPPESLWAQELVSSRLLAYEVWNRIQVRGVAHAHETARILIGRILMVEMTAAHLARALDPFPVSVRTLDSLHLSTIKFLRTQGNDVALASFDRRMVAAARAIGIPLYQV